MPEHEPSGLQSRQTLPREERVKEEWTANWKPFDKWMGIPKIAARFVYKWIKVRGLEGRIRDVPQLVNNAIDDAYEWYLFRYGYSQPKDIHRAIAQNIKIASRAAVTKALADQAGIVPGDSLEDMTQKTIESDKRADWLDELLLLPENDYREKLIKIAIGKAAGMSEREISREIGISHVGVSHFVQGLKGLLKDYYQKWLLDRVERRLVVVTQNTVPLQEIVEFLIRDRINA